MMEYVKKNRMVRIQTKWVVMIATGLGFLVSAGVVYIPYYVEHGIHELELTVLSNVIAGILFIYGGVREMQKRTEIPQVLYMNTILLLQLVFFICMAFINEFNFSGGFVFLHIVNPIIATIELFLFTSCKKKVNIAICFTSLIAPYLYLLYAILYGYASGNWIYGILNIPQRGIAFVLSLIVIAGLGILCLAWIQYKVSYFINQRR